MARIIFRMIRIAIVFIIVVIQTNLCGNAQEMGIQAYTKNQHFWEYKGKPILLVGASSNDNLFQNSDVVQELNLLQGIGANYVCCTLSGRDVGDEWPFWRTGLRFNLNKFNPDFWKKLDDFLFLTKERNIIVQLEIWAFHDFMGSWDRNPWNPVWNHIFTEENTYLKEKNYGDENSAKHDFFFSVPKLNNDSILLAYQKMFVDQLLSVSLNYKHVLYCISNDFFSQYSPEWGRFWADYLHQKAKEAGKVIQITEMLQNNYEEKEKQKVTKQSPEIYSFVEISQNEITTGDKYWEQLQNERSGLSGNIRPVNNIKIYGGQFGEWTGGPNHGIFRFWLDLIGGAASLRFHCQPFGIGLSERAQMQVKSARLLSEEYDFFTSQPDVKFVFMDERKEDEAYLASNKNKDAVVYFPDGGKIVLDFTDFGGNYELKWLNIEGATWYSITDIMGGKIIELESPYTGAWVALLKKKTN